MKLGRKCIMMAIAAVTMCTVMAVPVSASAYEKEYLFATELFEDEYLYRELPREYTSESSSSRYERAYSRSVREWDFEYADRSYVTRKADFSFRLDEDATLSDFVLVLIPEGKTMTIEKGVTLTIHGQLLVEGNLVNNGIIVLGDEKRASRRGETGIGSAQLNVEGEMKNAGAIHIIHGRLENTPDALTTNTGTITITNNHSELVGIANTTKKTGSDKVVGGRFVNDGTIDVRNTGGTGVRNQTGAVFQNNGQISMSQEASVKGTIDGNKPYRKDS